MIHVIKPGALTTVQDLGRPGFAHLGLSPAGAADSLSFRIANLLVGNGGNTPALEITLLGPTLEFEVAAVIAISGSATTSSLPVNEPVEVAAGTRLTIGPLTTSARAHLAVQGGIDVPKIMGSYSTFLPAQLGGFQGRALKAGDRIGIGKHAHHSCPKVPPDLLEKLRSHAYQPIRVTASLQQDWFDPDTVEHFYSQPFTVSDDSNRSGLRLMGEPIFPSRKAELLTEGVALGAVQVPPSGQPIILFVDQQTTGGYPKIANVIAADLPRVGQLRPRDEVRFEHVEIQQAIELLKRQEEALVRAFDL